MLKFLAMMVPVRGALGFVEGSRQRSRMAPKSSPTGQCSQPSAVMVESVVRGSPRIEGDSVGEEFKI